MSNSTQCVCDFVSVYFFTVRIVAVRYVSVSIDSCLVLYIFLSFLLIYLQMLIFCNILEGVPKSHGLGKYTVMSVNRLMREEK